MQLSGILSQSADNFANQIVDVAFPRAPDGSMVFLGVQSSTMPPLTSRAYAIPPVPPVYRKSSTAQPSKRFRLPTRHIPVAASCDPSGANPRCGRFRPTTGPKLRIHSACQTNDADFVDIKFILREMDSSPRCHAHSIPSRTAMPFHSLFAAMPPIPFPMASGHIAFRR